jgi:MraZ protein
MPAFISTFTFKVDRKGRVSVPAEFRAALTQPGFSGMVAFPSPHDDAIRCITEAQVERITGARDPLEVFQAGATDVALAAAADMVRLPFDGEGRVLLPKLLADYAGIVDSATFVGRMTFFEIWNPEAFAAKHAPLRAQQRGRANPLEGGHGRG